MCTCVCVREGIVKRGGNEWRIFFNLKGGRKKGKAGEVEGHVLKERRGQKTKERRLRIGGTKGRG